MKKRWLRLAADLLEDAASEYSNHGCNDWEFPRHWTDKEKRELVQAYRKWDGWPPTEDPDFDPDYMIPDWGLMEFLASLLKKEAEFNPDDGLR